MLPLTCSYMSCILGILYDMTFIMIVCLKCQQTKQNSTQYVYYVISNEECGLNGISHVLLHCAHDREIATTFT